MEMAYLFKNLAQALKVLDEASRLVALLDSPLVGAIVAGLLAMVASSFAAFYTVRSSLRNERRRYLVFQAITPLQARIEEVRFRIAQVLSDGEVAADDFKFDLQDYFGAAVILKDFQHLGEESRELLQGVPSNSHPAELFEAIVRNMQRVFSNSARQGVLTADEERELKRILGELAELRKCLSLVGGAILKGKIQKKHGVNERLEGLRARIVDDGANTERGVR